MIHYQEYIVVFAVAAVATWLATFAVRAVARRHALLVMPDERRVHERPTPTGGGTAMYLGMLVAVAVASQLPAFAGVFRGNSAPMGIVLGATVIFGVGMADDLREMSPPAKLAGQVLAGTVLYFLNVNMLYFHVPLAGTVVLSSNWAVLGTVLWVAVMANSVNFIDGLDGLAAGIVAIAAAAFFIYAHALGDVGNITSNNVGPLVAVITVGLCVGFLPHNFYPAKIFMGDAGAMLLGLLVAASTLAVVGQDSYQFSGRTYFFFAPIIIPFFILGIPLLDTLFAVIRRAGKRTSPAVADLSHLHHRLMRLGHGHRQAVLILWAWTALLSGVVLWPGVTNSHNEIPPIAVGALAILLYTLFAPRGRGNVAASDTGPLPDTGTSNGDAGEVEAGARAATFQRAPTGATTGTGTPAVRLVRNTGPIPLADGRPVPAGRRPGPTGRRPVPPAAGPSVPPGGSPVRVYPGPAPSVPAHPGPAAPPVTRPTPPVAGRPTGPAPLRSPETG